MSTPPRDRERQAEQEVGQSMRERATERERRYEVERDGREPEDERGREAGTTDARTPLVGGSLPRWGPWAVFSGVTAAVAGVLSVLGFNVALLAVASVVLTGAIIYGWARAVEGRRKATDRAITIAVSSAFALALTPLISLLFTVTSRGLARFDVQLFTESMRGVLGEGGGIQHAIVGTLVITGVATAASVPIGIMAAIYLHEYGRGRLKRALTFFVDVMTGIPSIVAGLFAYALFVLIYGPGIRLGVMGAVALSVLMIPIVVRSTEEMLRVVPNGLREASYALGVPKWRTIVKVVLPTSFAGIVSGAMIAVARIIGETAPLLITTGVFNSVNFNPFDGRMENLAVFAYNEYATPGIPNEPYIDRAWAAALTLLLIVMILFFVARLISARFGVKTR
ncbi:MAG: phosphate ABC transporter permease PstA [Solirubrobacteraceae bacterium MAG38_C4-C5]|nr:phosphate ABC transporter permease PstA [Candidatus Siliceabacter maunaloa]